MIGMVNLVYVWFFVFWQVKIDYVCYIFYIDFVGNEVGSDQYVEFFVFEILNGVEMCVLCFVGMDDGYIFI